MPNARITFDDLYANPELAARFRSPAVELLDGQMVRQPLPSAAVVAAVVRLAATFDEHAYGVRVGVRDAVASAPCDLLRPEVSLMRPGVLPFARPAPPATGLLLAVLVVDRLELAQERLRRCAVAGVPETWLLALDDGSGVAYGDPQAGRYRRRELLLPGEPCAPREADWLRVVPLLRERPAARSAAAMAAA